MNGWQIEEVSFLCVVRGKDVKHFSEAKERMAILSRLGMCFKQRDRCRVAGCSPDSSKLQGPSLLNGVALDRRFRFAGAAAVLLVLDRRFCLWALLLCWLVLVLGRHCPITSQRRGSGSVKYRLALALDWRSVLSVLALVLRGRFVLSVPRAGRAGADPGAGAGTTDIMSRS